MKTFRNIYIAIVLITILATIFSSCHKKEEYTMPPKGYPQGKFVIRFTREVIEDSITINTKFRPYWIKNDTLYLGYNF